jgi:hypothetical protein
MHHLCACLKHPLMRAHRNFGKNYFDLKKNFIFRLSDNLFLLPITDNGLVHSRGAKLDSEKITRLCGVL